MWAAAASALTMRALQDEDPRLRTMLGRRLVEDETTRRSEAVQWSHPQGEVDGADAKQRGVDTLNAIDQFASLFAMKPAAPVNEFK